MADKINTMTKLVASSTLGSSDREGTTVNADNLAEAIRDRKQEDGGAIVVAGSRSVVHALLDARLVDQINLQVFPVILGSGLRVHPDRPEPIRVELESSRALERGVLLQSYRVTG
ncbi:MAG TPA: dihydrofolate reductase family protein [Solirubrobacteraceae bacterium]|jgi:dihydrofolate reductase|nr:dihydrofolate reductase family protein [Solirubrobacteraceae bacterium]